MSSLATFAQRRASHHFAGCSGRSSCKSSATHLFHRQRERVICRASNELPSDEGGEMMQWARQAFANELRKPNFDLVKACLLVSLEEEAAISHFQHEAFSKVLEDVQPAMYEEVQDFGSLDALSMSSKSLWSASRLDCLADEALAVFLHNLHRTDLVRSSRKLRKKLMLRDVPEVRELVVLHPTLFLHCVSELLYEYQGYARMARHGDPDSYLLTSVLDRGTGSPIILSIIFREVCRRAGLDTAITILDGATYCVLWPVNADGGYGHDTITLNGQHLLVDAYTGGDLILEEEVKEMFDVEAMVASSDRDILYAVLAGLRDCNAAKALQRAATPSRYSMAKLLRLVTGPDVEVEEHFALSRAIAAAERALHVKPGYCELLLDAAVLYFLDSNYHTAWHHLETVHACIAPWLETLGGDLPDTMVDLREWNDASRAAYMQLEGADVYAEQDEGPSSTDWEGYNDWDGSVELLTRPQWPPHQPEGNGGLGGGPSALPRQAASGWAVHEVVSAELSHEEEFVGSMQLAGGGSARHARFAPAVAGWEDTLILLERPVWKGLEEGVTRPRELADSNVQTEPRSVGVSPTYGWGSGNDALGAHHIACSGDGSPPDDHDVWELLEQLETDEGTGDSEDNEFYDCTTRAPLFLDSSIFDSKVVADMMLLRHKVGLMLRES